MAGEIALRPSYWASVSGGKDSLYMLNLILHNLDKYPLNGVCHFELEIDCLLNSWSKKYYQCLTYECFLNYEGSCLISLYESCGACKGE